MKLDPIGVLADAWRMWKRDHDLLIRVAGPFLFLPAFMLQLLLPPLPVERAQGAGDDLAVLKVMADAVAAELGWYVLAFLVTQFALATLFALYLDTTRPDLRGAMTRALTLLPRFVLTMLLVSLPAMLGFFLLVIPGLVVLGRLMVVGVVLVAERPVSGVAAIGRSVTLTRGATLAVTGLISLALFVRWIAGEPFAIMDSALRSGSTNPVALVIVDALGAAVDAAAALAAALVAIAAYRRLVSSRGI